MRLPILTVRAALFALTACLLAVPGQAHFIWLSLRGEAQRSLVMHFSEGRLDDTAPYLTSNLAGASVFAADGGVLELSPEASGYRTDLDAPLALVGGHLVYGLFGRSGPPALLTYDAKGARTLDDAGQVLGLVAEVLAHQDGGDLVLTVLHAGVPVAGAEVKVVNDGSVSGQTLTTGEDGTARCPMPRSTVFACRALIAGDQAGEHEGEPYERTLRYSTLCVERVREVRIPEGADPEAWLALEAAHLREHRLPDDVHGIKGSVTVMVDGSRHEATFVQLSGQVEVFEVSELSTEDAVWARAALDDALMAVHQRPTFDYRRAQALHLLADAPGALGVTIQDERGSRVVVDDQLIQELRLRSGEGVQIRTFLEREELEGGRLLPTSETRVNLDAEGEIVSSATVLRAYQQVGEVFLPKRFQELQVGADATSRRELRFGVLEVIR
ncbi:MAG: hypothetical protein P8R46_01165 [Planctomycetota bacterium]|nr:hypothetical protein [Planctomycetota bacterium]